MTYCPRRNAQLFLNRLVNAGVSASSIWRKTQTHGERLQAAVERQREQVSVERIHLPDSRYDHDQRKRVSMDGGMVNIRGEGWHELRVGTIFDIEARLERNPQTQEFDEMAHGVNVHYTAILGSRDQFKPALRALAVQYDVLTARNRTVVADGALWIWDVAEDICPDGQQVVDWFCAAQHLSDAAHVLYPDDKNVLKRKRWLKTYKDLLHIGRVHKIIEVLNKRDIPNGATYCVRHQRRMQYLEFRENGLPTGSGTVESGVKQFKQLLGGTGMRWHFANANRMLAIRSAVLGNEFHTHWNAA